MATEHATLMLMMDRAMVRRMITVLAGTIIAVVVALLLGVPSGSRLIVVAAIVGGVFGAGASDLMSR